MELTNSLTESVLRDTFCYRSALSDDKEKEERKWNTKLKICNILMYDEDIQSFLAVI